MTRLLEERKALGLRQSEVAEQVGVHRTTYLTYEQGRRPPITVALRLSRLFSKPLEYLFPDPADAEADVR